MAQVTPHTEDLEAALRQVAAESSEYPALVDRRATQDIEEDYLDAPTIAKIRENGIHSPQYRTYLRWRRMMVARLTARKFTYQEIADKLGISIHSVAQDIKTIRSQYDNIATRDWALLVEERIMQIDADIVDLRRLSETMPSMTVELEDGTTQLIGPDIDQRLRIMDRIFALEARRDKLLGIDQAASRQHIEKKAVEVTVSFDKPAVWTDAEAAAIEAEIIDLEAVE